MRCGIVGLGYWGSKVFDEYVSARDRGTIDAVVACDEKRARLTNLSQPDGTYESLCEMLPEIDAVHVCTPNETHYSIAEKALLKGKDVLVEKPLTIDKKQAYDLVEIASEKGQILQTGHIFRFADIVRDLRQKYEQGYFGEVRHLTLRWTHKIEPRPDTNVLWDLLPHPIDIVNFITGYWPENVSVRTSAPRTNLRPESADIHFDIGGTPSTIQVSWLDHVKRRSVEIAGAKRAVQAECTEQTMTVFGDSTREDISFENNTIRAEIENFVNAIQTGQNSFNSAIVGARTVDNIQAIENKVQKFSKLTERTQ